ncbi:hypothetical protein LMG19282_01461 [Cupriavidus campinensis]|uniref:Uncharacterized protein n=1 Tax=Cupriavidus campinensis TaxID=151783 RepID=A0ABY3EJA8_9BURK|nr:cell division protein ZapB [Cupriavidus campinensis]TSP11011.1 hypothetical protein FGG12_19300 [Cupriavidus campinensis]CAG2138202.1 hypothetical protein LMG19282_01461 [Cupriavidus campinensis]
MNNLNLVRTATLRMLSGNLCSLAELSIYLEQYGYVEDTANHCWVIADDSAELVGCALQVVTEGEEFLVYGDAPEHFANLNYVIHKAGWSSCKVACESPEVEARLLARLVNVDVDSAIANSLPASTLRANAPGVSLDHYMNAPGVGAVAAVENALSDDGQRIQELTIRYNTLEERASELESANASLQQENSRLRAQQAAGNHPPSTVDAAHTNVNGTALLNAIEGHLGSLIDMSATTGSTLLADLRKLGFGVRLKLVPLTDAAKG